MVLLAISLLTILAGTLLLAKFKKEMAGKFFVFISWFFIVVGFLLFIGFVSKGIYWSIQNGCPVKPSFRHEMMMKKFHRSMPGNLCFPRGMHRGMCPGSGGCMQHDSMIIRCPENMEGDSLTVIVKKE